MGLTPVILNSRFAKRYAELHLVSDDLRQTEECLKELVSRNRTPAMMGAPVELALVDSALIRYRRCFNRSHMRLRLDQLIPKLTPEDQATHRYVLALASNHIAHSYSNLEHNVPIVYVDLEASPMVINSPGTLGQSSAGLSLPKVGEFYKLVRELKKLADRWREDTVMRLRQEIASLTEDEIRASPIGTASGIMRQPDVTKPRS